MKSKKTFKRVLASSLAIIISLSFAGYDASAWSSNTWKSVADNGNGEGTGHKSMILNIASSYFTCPGSTDTDLENHRNIVAEAAFLTDDIACMSASGNTPNLSPYHAKAELNGISTGSSGYALDTVKNQHLKFLYELARRRLVLGSKLDLNPSNYTASNYYGVTIDVSMKQRIISDLVVLNQELVDQGYDMTKVDHQGYMVLGVYFHLLEDIYCHRAKATQSMVSGINAAHINYTGTDAQKRTWLSGKIGSTGIPMIRLKDYLIDSNLSVSYLIGTNTYTATCSDNQAYEDNPFYNSVRYTRALDATETELSEIMADTDLDNASDFSFTTYSNVPLK